MDKIYEGNVEIRKTNQKKWQEKLKGVEKISGDLDIRSDAELSALKSVGGDLYISSDAELSAPKLESVGGDLDIRSDAELSAPKLESVGGYLYISSEIDSKLEKRLWKYNKKKKWIMTQHCSEWLLSRKGNGKITYKINSVAFNKTLFDKVRKDKLTAKQVFLIKNMEQRRIAYEFMDKIKMNELKGLKVLDEQTDPYNNQMRIISFKRRGYRKPFKFLHCICPSTGREYFLETQQDICENAKARSFGFESIKFDKEW